MNNAGLPLISLSGAETAQALSQNLSQTSERRASSIKRASSTDFSFYLGGPLQRPDPLRFHIFVPTPVIWLRSTRNTPHVSRCSSCAIYLDFSAFAPSLSSLLMRSEFFFFGILWCDPQVKAANEMHILELSQYTKSKEDVRGAKTKPCVNSTLPHVNKLKFPRLSHKQHKSADVRKKCLYLLNCRIQTQLDSCKYSVHSAKHTVCTSCCPSILDDWLTMLTVRFRLGTRPMPQSLFSSFIFFWPFKSGSCVAASHSTNIFPNRNLMTQGNLCFILALP